MIDVPTDRLHKFLAIGGLLLVVLGIFYPLQKYEEAELHRIEALSRLENFANSFLVFESKVSEFRPLYEAAIRDGADSHAAQELSRRLLEKQPALDALQREAAAAGTESRKNIHLMQHYYVMRNVWMAIGIVLMVLGVFSALRGFSIWLKQPQKNR